MNNDIKLICLDPNAGFEEIIKKQNGCKKRNIPAGIAIVTDKRNRVIGTITDGDLRRALLTNTNLAFKAKDIMIQDPILFPKDYSYQQILEAIPSELDKRKRKSRTFLGEIIKVDDDGCPVGVFHYHHLWEQRVATHRKIVVLGMGYVGLTLAVELAREGFEVVGVDKDQKIVKLLRSGKSHVHEVGIEDLMKDQLSRNLKIMEEIPDASDVIIVAVGTPVIKSKQSKKPIIDLSFLLDACSIIGDKIKRGSLVILRSTVPVGTTKSKVLPILEKISGLKAGEGFHLSYAPERTVEGRALKELRQLPQIISGINKDSIEATVALFRELTPAVIRVSSVETAELSKLINNCYRDLTFAFSNQLVQLAYKFNIDLSESIRASNTGYPRGMVPLPSPGVGGPCLTKDPYILSSQLNNDDEFISLFDHGRTINENVMNFIVDKLLIQIMKLGKEFSKTKILVCGMAFKGYPETTDLRESVSISFVERLKEMKGNIFIQDSVVPKEKLSYLGLECVDLPIGFKDKDVVLFMNNHSSYGQLNASDMIKFLNTPCLIFDGWNHFLPDEIIGIGQCVYMGLGNIQDSIDES